MPFQKAKRQWSLTLLLLLNLGSRNHNAFAWTSYPRQHSCSSLIATNPVLAPKTLKTLTTQYWMVSPYYQESNGNSVHEFKNLPQFLLNTLLSSLFAMSLLLGFSSPAVASTPSTQSPMVCATRNCQKELSDCMRDSQTCAPGLACLLRCQIFSGGEKEGACQVRCMDLYENPPMEALTECTLTQHQCYPPMISKTTINKFPSIRLRHLGVDDFELKVLEGDWYVTAGGNPTFDTFPCAKHSFQFIIDEKKKEKDPSSEYLQAKFTYRITRDDGSVFTRSGGKRIAYATNNINNKNQQQVSKSGRGGELELRLDPDRMNYVDDWTILSYMPNEYVVVYYHGTNVAWEGYGGLNVYTRYE